MRRWGRWILWGLLGAAGAMVGGFCLMLFTVDPARLSSDAARELSAVLGQEVRFAGSPSVGVWPLPGIDTGTIETDGGILKGGSAVIVPHPMSLLTGRGDPWAIVLVDSELALGPDEPEAVLTRSTMRPQGIALRHLGLLAARVRTASGAAPITRVSALITLGGGGTSFGMHLTGDWRGQNVGLALRATDPRLLLDRTGTDVELDLDVGLDRIAYTGHFGHDQATGRLATNGRGAVRLANPQAVAEALGIELPDHLTRLTNLNGTIQSQTLNSLLRVKANLVAQLGARAITLQGVIEGDAGWREKGPSTLNVVSRGGGLFSAYLDGAFDGPERFSGQLQVSVADMPALQDLIGIPIEARLIEAVRGTLRAAFAVDETSMRLTDGEIRIGERALATEMKLKSGGRPSLSVSLDLPGLDLTPAYKTAFVRLRNGLAWIETAGIDMNLLVKTASARIGAMDLGTLELDLTHRAGVASIDVGRFDFLDGLGNARLRLATTGPARLTGEIALAEVDAAALSEATGLGLLTGTAGGYATFEIPDVASLRVAGIALTGEMTVTDGQLRIPLGADDTMPFDQAGMKLRMAAGRLTAQDIALMREAEQTTGEITIALPARSLSGELTLPDGAQLTIGGPTGAPTALRTPVKPVDETDGKTTTSETPPTDTAVTAASPATDGTVDADPPSRPDANWTSVRTAAAPRAPEAPESVADEDPDTDTRPEAATPETPAPEDVATVPIPIPAPR